MGWALIFEYRDLAVRDELAMTGFRGTDEEKALL